MDRWDGLHADIYQRPRGNGRHATEELRDVAAGWLGNLRLAAPLPDSLNDGVTPVGGEVRVNETNIGIESQSQVVVLADGSMVFTWQAFSNSNVMARRYDAEGAPLGGEFIVNTTVTGTQDTPSIAALANGGFVIVWVSEGQDGDEEGVYGQRFDASGAPAGGEFLVNTATDGEQDFPIVRAHGAGGGFVVAWVEDAVGGGTTGDIRAQFYSANGAPSGGEFTINSAETGYQSEARLATLEGGGVIAVWTGVGPGDSFGIFGQRYDASGSPAGTQFLVNADPADSQFEPAVAALEGGGFVVSWIVADAATGDQDIVARMFSSDGAPVSGDIDVTTAIPETQYRPAVAGVPGGGFLLAFQSLETGNSDVIVRLYRSDGVQAGEDAVVNETTTNSQALGNIDRQQIAVHDDGSATITWWGNGIGDTLGIFMRRFYYDSGQIVLTGTNGPDLIVGGPEDELLRGLGGNDTLRGNRGADALDGASGKDWADYSDGGRVRADLFQPASNIGQAAGDTYSSIENLRGSAFADILRGDNGANVLEGGIKNDALRGRAGNDTLIGGIGFDRLEGQGGADHFVLSSTTPDSDIIEDFIAGTDKLSLDGGLFGLAPGALDPDAFVAANNAQDAEDRLVYRAATGKLYYDPDGTGAQAQVLIATLENLPTLAATDFVVT